MRDKYIKTNKEWNKIGINVKKNKKIMKEYRKQQIVFKLRINECIKQFNKLLVVYKRMISFEKEKITGT